MNRAAIYSMNGEQRRAIIDLDLALSHSPRSSLAFYNRGYAYFALKDYGKAIDDYHRITDLVGRPVVWNGPNSGIAVPARYVMDGLGLDIDRDFQPIYTDKLSFGPALIADGRASALWGAGQRWPGFIEVANDPRGARLIAPDPDEIKRIHAKHNFLVKLTVPAGLYRGQTDPIDTVGAWSFVFARADLDEPIGYRLASALYKINRGGAFSSQLAETTPRNTIVAIPRPDVLQSGVLRFYKKMELFK